MQKRSPARKPSSEIERILNVVRTLPAEVELPNLHMEALKLMRQDAEGLLKAINLKYDVDSMSPEDSDWDERAEARIAFERERRSAIAVYQVRAFSNFLMICPPAFQEYIGLGDHSLESLSKAFYDSFGDSSRIEDLNTMVSESPDTIQTLFDIRNFKAIRRYDEAKRLHEQCYGLLVAIEKAREIPESVLPEIYDEIEIHWANIGTRLGVQIGKNIVRFQKDAFTYAFDGVDPNRLRRCDHCRRIFWLRRISKDSGNIKFGCTPKCTSYLSTRKWRDKTTEEQRKKYKINRIKKGG